jgi:protoporphyrinogen oxidase
MRKSKAKESIAVIGGGVTGIAASIELAKTGHFRVTLLEKQSKLGGLSSYYQWQDLICDRFYHVILPKDSHLLDFIKELNLESVLFWKYTKSGFYKKEQLVSLSSAIDFLRFPFLSIQQKFRMALGFSYNTRIKEPSKLDKLNAQQWLTSVFGQKVYENIWEPLLRGKLGDAADRTSAAFIWATIKRLFSSRRTGSYHEKMGHVRGGYCTILNAVKKKLTELDVKVLTNSNVLRVCALDNINSSAKFRKENIINIIGEKDKIELKTDSSNLEFDKILFTIPNTEILQILENVNNHSYWQRLRQVDYLGVICVFLILSRKLSPYYVINLLEKELPFTGIIESTNIISPKHFGKKHLVYLPKYVLKNDPLSSNSDDQIFKLFVKRLKSVFPDLKDEEILHKKIFRENSVQAVQGLNFLGRTIGFRTPIPNIYLANSSMIYDSTLNNNAVIKLAQKAANTILSDAVKGSFEKSSIGFKVSILSKV